VVESTVGHLTNAEMLVLLLYLLSAWYLIRTGMLTQFLLDDSGKLSNVKLWSFVANAVASYVVIHYTIDGKLTSEMFFVYLGCVGGSAIASKLIAFKYGGASDNPTAEHEVPSADFPSFKRNPANTSGTVPNAVTPDDPDSGNNISGSQEPLARKGLGDR
jgi:hypothetical protein